MIRLDGNGFSKWTKGLKRPYDERMTNLMIDTTKFLAEKTNSVINFCQSDEISICLYTDQESTELFFNGKIQKLTSIVAAMCTAFFNKNVPKYIPEKTDTLAWFDCRVWNVPSLVEATNVFIWRELDATKNAISMVAQHHFSHKQLQNKNGKEMQEMLFTEKGINFNDFASCFKRGSYIRRVKKMTKFSFEEICNLPEKHAARFDPDLVIERNVIERVELPPMAKVINKVDVLFHGKDPEILSVDK
jgi:tRNA(His) 5'-end guanylyltransferase